MSQPEQTDSLESPSPWNGACALPGRKLLTKKELAIRYAVVPRTIDNWIAQRQIPFLKLGRKLIRFDPEECDRALQRFKVEAAPEL
jgi:hypothetical protein